jgi:hypothetical protein
LPASVLMRCSTTAMGSVMGDGVVTGEEGGKGAGEESTRRVERPARSIARRRCCGGGQNRTR